MYLNSDKLINLIKINKLNKIVFKYIINKQKHEKNLFDLEID